jgi:hypothetical protein
MTRFETRVLKIPVSNVSPFHESERGKPTLTETSFIGLSDYFLLCGDAIFLPGWFVTDLTF